MKAIPENRDLINDNGLDEMQKSYAYKLAFKCFKALYWIMFVISFVMIMLATTVEDSVIFAITALVVELSSSIVYIVFGVKTSKLGAINPVFSKDMASPKTIAGYFALAVVYVVWFVRDFIQEGGMFYIFALIYMLILVGTFITLGFISKNNNKVIEETEED